MSQDVASMQTQCITGIVPAQIIGQNVDLHTCRCLPWRHHLSHPQNQHQRYHGQEVMMHYLPDCLK